MRTRPTILFFGPVGQPVPDLVLLWAEGRGFPVEVHADPSQIEAIILRGHPCLLFIDADRMGASALDLVRRLKSDPFAAIIPVLVLAGNHDAEQIQTWFSAGADEILTKVFPPAEQRARLDALQVRTQRDVSVHPSTRMPGTTEIEREIRRRLEGSLEFAVCYADLDHFKEYNDRYSYYDGDRVIYILSRILHDVVKGLLGPRGFVGHIGGDDFIFIIPAPDISTVCGEIISVFDLLVPFQYNEQDRRAGYFFGKDRRGQLHRVPLMTLSIGIVTNRHRTFAHPAEVSELATEMKSYAKTLPGSVYVVDRRHTRSGEERVAGAPVPREPAGEPL
ncbi:MAG TPA: diguanylate cyclase [Gemmatimonadales bacterium]|nr:diguanylate cyclase [Gemmatimonadales bacterium]